MREVGCVGGYEDTVKTLRSGWFASGSVEVHVGCVYVCMLGLFLPN